MRTPVLPDTLLARLAGGALLKQATTAVTVGELAYGATASIAPISSSARWACSLARCVLAFDEPATRHYGRLQ